MRKILATLLLAVVLMGGMAQAASARVYFSIGAPSYSYPVYTAPVYPYGYPVYNYPMYYNPGGFYLHF